MKAIIFPDENGKPESQIGVASPQELKDKSKPPLRKVVCALTFEGNIVEQPFALWLNAKEARALGQWLLDFAKKSES